MKIVLASNNQNKLREFRNILEPLGYEVITQAEAGADIEADENGSTFEENAFIKANAAHQITKLPVIADDSGLEVDFLGGAPGVYSARYAEPEKRCAKVLSKLEDVPDEKRSARFICAVCYINEKGESFTVKGTCEGKIGYEKRGTNGFGYDPIFLYGDRTFAELSAEEKNQVSHRAIALRKFQEMMKKGWK